MLLAHGFNDYNVVPEHSVRIYNEMKARGLPVSIYLHQGGHGGNPPADMVNRWFSHYLYGVDNGVEKIRRCGSSRMPPRRNRARWPLLRLPRGAMPARQSQLEDEGADGRPPRRRRRSPRSRFRGRCRSYCIRRRAGRGIANLSFTNTNAGTDKFIDDVAMSGSADASAGQSTHRLLYATPLLTDTVHISGTPRVTLRIASSEPAANLSVWLVMLPYDSATVGSASHAGLIDRGWADIQNYKSLTQGGNYDSKQPGEKLVPGKFYDLTFDLQPDDEFVPAGKRLALMIMSSDREFTLWPRPGTTLTVDLAHSSIAIPIVGGATALNTAGMR